VSEGVSFDSLEKLQAGLKRLTEVELAQLAGNKGAGHAIGLELENILKTSPGRPSHPLRWASARQRRWYFWARANHPGGALPAKYTRISDPWSKKLEQKWVTKSSRTETVTGSPVPYAPYVQSEQYQTEMHQTTGWTTDEQAWQKLERDGTINRIVIQAIDRMVRQSLRGLG